MGALEDKNLKVPQTTIVQLLLVILQNREELAVNMFYSHTISCNIFEVSVNICMNDGHLVHNYNVNYQRLDLVDEILHKSHIQELLFK